MDRDDRVGLRRQELGLASGALPMERVRPRGRVPDAGPLRESSTGGSYGTPWRGHGPRPAAFPWWVPLAGSLRRCVDCAPLQSLVAGSYAEVDVTALGARRPVGALSRPTHRSRSARAPARYAPPPAITSANLIDSPTKRDSRMTNLTRSCRLRRPQLRLAGRPRRGTPRAAIATDRRARRARPRDDRSARRRRWRSLRAR